MFRVLSCYINTAVSNAIAVINAVSRYYCYCLLWSE